MYAPIYFDNQIGFGAIEVGYKEFDGMLPTEVETVNLIVPQPLPQHSLGGSHILAKFFGACENQRRCSLENFCFAEVSFHGLILIVGVFFIPEMFAHTLLYVFRSYYFDVYLFPAFFGVKGIFCH